jgi:biuret amidohydrolase
VVREAVGGSSLVAHEAALAAIEYLQHGAVISEKEVCE